MVGEDKDTREVGWEGEGAYAAGTAGLLGAGGWGEMKGAQDSPLHQPGGRAAGREPG